MQITIRDFKYNIDIEFETDEITYIQLTKSFPSGYVNKKFGATHWILHLTLHDMMKPFHENKLEQFILVEDKDFWYLINFDYIRGHGNYSTRFGGEIFNVKGTHVSLHNNTSIDIVNPTAKKIIDYSFQWFEQKKYDSGIRWLPYKQPDDENSYYETDNN